MKTWNAEVKLYGEEETRYISVDFEISNELYDELMELREKGILIKDSKYLHTLSQLAQNEALNMLKDSAADEYDLPERDYYDSDEEYQEAMDEYNNEIEDYCDSFSIDETIIIDPTEYENFKKEIIGRILADYDEEDTEIELDFDGDWPDYKDHHIELEIENGVIKDIIDIECRALCYENPDDYEECEPDYELLLEELEDYLE